ncbi:hypothetical protein DA2_3611 [Desulfovibrio sp. A2]|nr:hypothetical protein DA2_3611 [Desulfovibrio sp. A2]
MRVSCENICFRKFLNKRAAGRAKVPEKRDPEKNVAFNQSV